MLSPSVLPQGCGQNRCAAQQRGALLIEALIVILIFSFGLLAIAGLQAKATQVAVSAEDSNRAAMLANDLASQMWAQRSAVLPDAEVTAWQDRVSSPTSGGLPNGAGSVDVTGSVARITITWKAPTASASSQSNKYTTDVVIN